MSYREEDIENDIELFRRRNSLEIYFYRDVDEFLEEDDFSRLECIKESIRL